jgi:hypothetical protein
VGVAESTFGLHNRSTVPPWYVAQLQTGVLVVVVMVYLSFHEEVVGA